MGVFWVFEHERNFMENLNNKTDHWTGQWISISVGALPQTRLGELTALP